ncbi:MULTISPECIES: sugar transferase [Maribacter]|uniref:Sugar transferase n=1 Tax=Maribacter flavus TaxID=1658664 RepID=A0ABU7IEE2_9FLAO|nr:MULTISPECIES: sugar transferase [Maribacter]MDC6404176.1 sugar transferase [Maribacter sp. PR66]MEE1971319.1 sugar transferase [Maribacter flavus]
MPKPLIFNTKERKTILVLGDFFIIGSALNVFINDALDIKVENIFFRIIFYVSGTLFFFLLSYVLNFYNLERPFKTRLILSQSFFIVGSFVLTIFIGTVLFFDASFWRIPLIIFLFLTPLEIFLWRYFFGNLFKVIPAIRNVMYVFDKEIDDDHQKYIDQIDGDGMESYYKTRLTYSIDNVTILERKKFMDAMDKIDSFILNIPSYDQLSPRFEKMLIEAILKGKEVLSFTTFYENIYEALPLKSHNDSFYELLQLKNGKIRYLEALFTFIVNWLFILVVGAIFIFFLPIVFVLNLFFNRGPLFYTQKRVGQYGKEFSIFKFRSMVVDAESTGAKMAAKNDARITPFGKILRMFRIDELPQLISIIKGDMQLIGPRPERKIFVDKLNEIKPFYSARHLIKPGITGWAQVKYKYGENLEDSIRKLEYDMYYIKNKSITLDIRIIFKTITTVLFSRGI